MNRISANIKVKPLSINKAFQGRRFKTPEYKAYEEEVLYYLKQKKLNKVSGYVSVKYDFCIKNYKASDVGNMEKLLSDIIVKAGLIDDDRFIKKLVLEKFQSNEETGEFINIFIEPL